MARIEDRRKATELRLAGATFTHIKESIGVSKSTLSSWLKNIQLSEDQIKKITGDAKSQRIERYIKTTKERRQKIFENFCKIERDTLLPLSKRELYIAGLFLYLGEGAKSDWWRVIISNSNPDVIKFSIFWLTNVLKVPRAKLKIQVHLYTDMDIEQELKYWRQITSLRRNQFMKPYIKKTSSKRIDHSSFGHGTCNVYLGNVNLKHKILAGIRVILESVNSGRIV